MDDILKLVGAKIRELRKAQDLSQEALGEKAGFHFSYVGAIERGEKNISLLNLGKLAKALNVGVYQFFSAVQQYEQMEESEAPSEMKEILLKLQNRSTADLKRANAILNEIFKQY